MASMSSSSICPCESNKRRLCGPVESKRTTNSPPCSSACTRAPLMSDTATSSPRRSWFPGTTSIRPSSKSGAKADRKSSSSERRPRWVTSPVTITHWTRTASNAEQSLRAAWATPGPAPRWRSERWAKVCSMGHRPARRWRIEGDRAYRGQILRPRTLQRSFGDVRCLPSGARDNPGQEGGRRMTLATLVYLLVVLAPVSLLVTLLAHAAVFIVLSPRRTADAPALPITVLKPVKGAEPGLYENLASLARQDHPAYEILVAAEDARDPALEVARRVQDDFPHVPIRIHPGARVRDREIDAAAQERPRATGRPVRGAQPARRRLRHRPHVRSGRLPRRAVAVPGALRERRLDGGALPQPPRALGTDAAPHRARGISRRVAAQPRALHHPRHRRALVHAAAQGPAPGRRRRGGSGREGRLRRLGQPPPARVPAAPVRSPADAAQGPGNGGGLAGGVLPGAGELARGRGAYRGGRQARAGRGATGRDRAGGDMIARLLRLDELLFRRIGSFRPSGLVRVMRGLTHLGNAESWFAIGFFLLACGGQAAHYGMLLGTGALLPEFTCRTFKQPCCRPRPRNKRHGF